MKWRDMLVAMKQLQEVVELNCPDANVAHYAYMRLNRALAEAQEILEAFVNDEEEEP